MPSSDKSFGPWPLHVLAAQLPFHPDDLDALVTLFRRWRVHRQEEDKMALELWAYYAIYRYCLVFLVCRRKLETVELEQCVGQIFATIRAEIPKLESPDQLIECVQAICRQVLGHAKEVSRKSNGPRPSSWLPLKMRTNGPDPDAPSEPEK